MYDFSASLKHYLVHYRGFSAFDLPDSLTWNFWKDQWGMTMDEFLGYCNDGVDAGVVFGWGQPEDGTAGVLYELQERGHTIHLVTHRMFGDRSVQNTEDWLKQNNIPFDTITFAKDKTVIPVDLFFEDNVDNYNALVDAGTAAVLFDRPWNQDATDATRVYNWYDFETLVDDMESEDDEGEWVKVEAPYETGLEEATRYVYGLRNNDYGHPFDDYKRTSALWTTLLAGSLKKGKAITPQQAIVMMIAVKLSRLTNDHTKRDSAVDVAGYAECLIRCNRREAGEE